LEAEVEITALFLDKTQMKNPLFGISMAVADGKFAHVI
jgi:hypothetical protein